MKRRAIYLACILLALPSVARANGDPVISYSANIRSCNPVPLKVSEVQIVREDLNIKLMVPYTDVTVKYRLKNNSARSFSIDYGFPLDFTGKPGDPHDFKYGDDWSESRTERGIADKAVRDIRFFLDGRELAWTRADAVVTEESTYEDEDMGTCISPAVSRLWSYTAFEIPSHAEVELEIRYSVLVNWYTGLSTLAASPLSRFFPYGGQFYYDFTPAQHWGNGKVTDFYATLDCSGLMPMFLAETSPSVYSEGLEWVRRGNRWNCYEKNFDLAKAEPLEVGFWKDWAEAGVYSHWGDPLKDCAVPAAEYVLTTTSAQAKYPSGNLSDGSLETAWVASGNGVGSAIEIRFPQPRRVSDVALYNGYGKSQALWTANSRIKTIRLEVTRADGFVDEPVEMDISDWSGRSFSLRDDRKPHFREPTFLTVTDLFRQNDGRERGSDENGMILYDEVPFENEYVSLIRIVVLETLPGTKYNDLCVSEVVVYDAFE